VTAPRFIVTNGLYAPTVTGTYALAAPRLVESNALYAPSAPSVYPLTTPGFTETDNTFYLPTVLKPAGRTWVMIL
jgi:hypothetical protein